MTRTATTFCTARQRRARSIIRRFLIIGALAAALSLVASAGVGRGETRHTSLSIDHTLPTATSNSLTQARSEARHVTARFLGALDQGKYDLACSLLAQQFYRRHHIPDRNHCVTGFKIGMGGTAVKFHILAVAAQTDRALVHVSVDGSPGTVELIREAPGFRITAMRAD